MGKVQEIIPACRRRAAWYIIIIITTTKLPSSQQPAHNQCMQCKQFLYFRIVQLNLEEWEHGNKKRQQVEIWNKISEFKQDWTFNLSEK